MGRKKRNSKKRDSGPIIRDPFKDQYSHQCFCGTRLPSELSTSTCGSLDCIRLAEQFGEVSNWLNQQSFINVDNQPADERAEKKIIMILESVFGLTQKLVASETGLAVSTISSALNRLERKGIVCRDEFHDVYGNLLRKKRRGGRPTIIWRIN